MTEPNIMLPPWEMEQWLNENIAPRLLDDLREIEAEWRAKMDRQGGVLGERLEGTQ